MTSLGSTADGQKISQVSQATVASGSGNLSVTIRFTELTRVKALVGLAFKTSGLTTVEQEWYGIGAIAGQDANVVGLTLSAGAATTVTATATAVGY